MKGGRSQDGREIGRGDHFLPKRFIKRSFECWATSTKQLLNTGRGHQDPRKAAHSLQKEVGQNIEDKKTKELGTETHPREGVVKEEWFPSTRKPSHQWSVGSFGISEGNITRRGKYPKHKTHRICALTTTNSGEIAQRLMSATSKRGRCGLHA